jgi:hypothetical protein
MENRNRITNDDVPIKPVEQIPVKKIDELKKVDSAKAPDPPKLNLNDYINIIKGLLRNKALKELGFDTIDTTLFLIILIAIIIGFIILLIKT